MSEGAGKTRARKGTSAGKAGAATGKAAARTDEANGAVQNMTDLEYLRELIDAVDSSGIDSIEINRAGTRIRIAKTPSGSGSNGVSFVSAPPQYAPPAAPVAAQGQAAAAPAAEAAPAAPVSNLVDVKSPMVGTYYRAPAPDAPAYVEVGSTVTKGQTLCILEAMKLMNELESEVDGVVREILVEDADPVEYGQVLFRVEPSK